MMPWSISRSNRGGGVISRLLYSGAFLYGLVLVGAALVVFILAARRSAVADEDVFAMTQT